MLFSLRELQEKCREQRRPLPFAFIDLTKAFDLVSRQSFWSLHSPTQDWIVPPPSSSWRWSCPSTMAGQVQSSMTYQPRAYSQSRVVLRSSVFSSPWACSTPPMSQKMVFFPHLLAYVKTSLKFYETEARSGGSLFNLARLRAALNRRCQSRWPFGWGPQRLMPHFATACWKFALTISLKKTNIIAQDISTIPAIFIGKHTLDGVEKFTYLGSKISNNLSLDTALDVRIGKATTAMARLAKRVWGNTMLTLNTKMRVYQACMLRTLLYGSETWTLYSHQERRLNAFHMHNPRKHLGQTQASCPRQACPACSPSSSRDACAGLGHVCKMEDVASQRTFCTETSPQELDHLAGPPYATRIPARETACDINRGWTVVGRRSGGRCSSTFLGDHRQDPMACNR